MRIEIEIPDWAKDNCIYVMAGIELLAYKKPNGELKTKTVRCAECGLCCKEMECEHLDHLNRCSLAINRPFRCCITKGDQSYCKVRFD